MSAPAPPVGVVEPLLRWSRTELRDLPWRRSRDPWHILVSETMLQQTQVSRVIDRYATFLERFPTATACAEGTSAEVINLWAGLGYNRRAVNLWRTASTVAAEHGGVLPNDRASLEALPGIGPYTARAVLAFAFEQDVGVVDTNVGRLLARWTGKSLTAKQAQTCADALVPRDDGWRWNQSLFDFAVAQCTKRDPDCESCVLAAECSWQGSGPDPATGSAGVSGHQSKFAGSERQVRGRIVDAMRSGPIELTTIAKFGRTHDTDDDIARIVVSLVADGLAQETDGRLHLPGV